VVPTGCSSGRNYFAVAAFDPGANRWSFVAPLQTPRNRAAVVTAGDGRVYAIAGQQPLTPCSGTVNALSSVEAYTPATNSWAYVAPMLVARQFPGATEGIDGRIYVFGGRNSAGAILSDDEVYDPTSNTWTTIAPMPDPRAQTAVATDRQGRIYVVGGDDGTGGSASVERYTPATNTWDTGVTADPAGGTLGGTGVRGTDGRIYLIGMGFVSAGPPWAGTNIMIYDPATDAWSDSPQLALVTGTANPSGWMAGVAVNGTIYAVGPANIGGTFEDTVQSLAPAVQTSSTTISTPSSAVYGQVIGATATVTGTDGGGTVSFNDGSTPIAGCQSVALAPVGAAYQAQCPTLPLSAGTHSISASYSGDPTSTASASAPAAVAVSAAPLVITASSATMSYGGTPPPITPTVNGLQSGDTVSALGPSLACSTPASSSSPVGSYQSSCSGAVDDNYSISYETGTVAVTPVQLIVVASSATVGYGQGLPAITPTYAGFVNGDNALSLTTQPTCGTTATASSAVGTYAASCTGAADPNYTIGYVAGAIQIDQPPLMITAPSGTMTYGESPPALTPIYSGFVNGDGPASLTAAATCTTTATSSSPTGTYSTTCSGASDPNYAVTYTPGEIVVGPRPLVVTASSASTTYGDNLPLVTPSYAGFANGDSAASLTTQPTCGTTATSASPVGIFPTTCSGASDPNYAISYMGGSVSVSPAPLTVTASSASTTYGSPPPPITPSYTGFVNGETVSVLGAAASCTTTATPLSSVGSYPTSCSGATAGNYAITYVSGSVTVAPAPLSLAASSNTMSYGATPPTITPVINGLQNGDGLSALGPVACSTTATSTSPVGVYSSSCAGASDPNYLVSYANGTVIVVQAPLTVTASSGSMTYGASVPPVGPAYTGFVNGETPAALSTLPTCSTSATSSSAIGDYATTCQGATDGNYAISYVAGAIHVVPAPLTITASSPTATYGGPMPGVTPSFVGFVNGEGPSVLGSTLTCSMAAISTSAPGSYETSCSGAADSNYTVQYVPGTVSVLAAALTVTADNQTMQSGTTVPTLTTTIGGFVNGQTLATSDVIGQPNCTTTATSSSAPGTYPITCTIGTLNSTDYVFAFSPGTLTVTYQARRVCNADGTLTVGLHQVVQIGRGCRVKGRITVSSSGTLIVQGAVIRGNITFTGSGTLRICSSRINGNVTIDASSGAVVLGDGTPACPGDTIGGHLVVTSNQGPVIVSGTTVHGLLQVVHNTGGVTVTGNVIRGTLIVLDNADPVVISGNTVKH
jgi:hypothetical protein